VSIEIISEKKTQIGQVTVTFTVGRIVSQAKATEGKAGNAEGTPLVRQTTTGTGLRVGAADAVQPATSEFMDVTAGETAPSSDYDHGYADGVEWATKKYAPGTSDSAPNHQPHAVSQGWQDIETAPRDGTPFLCFHPDDVFSPITGIDLIWWEPGIGRWTMDGDNKVPFVGEITHWMPLPAPPSPAKTGGAE